MGNIFKDTKSTLLGVLILVVGIVAGVLLVQRTQDIRNKAKENVEYTFLICHLNEKGNWEEIKVGRDELENYLNKGDILGNCQETKN